MSVGIQGLQPVVERPGPGTDALYLYNRLAAYANQIQNAIQTFAVKPGNGAANVTITFTHPFSQTPQGIAVCPDWATNFHVTAISTTAVTIAFGTVSPGANNIVRVTITL